MWNRPQHLLREYAPLELQVRLDPGARLEKILRARPAPGGGGARHPRVDCADDRQIRLDGLCGVERKPEERRTV